LRSIRRTPATRTATSARVAELNHYPGPKHVLELTDKLGLDAEQMRETQRIYDVMHESTTTLGRQLVEKERALDDLFAAGEADEARAQALINEIATIRGGIRFGHVRAHLTMKAAMTAAQIERYDELRGYAEGHHGHGH
jgi:Spy/CpxP family protein refolding chaperone